MLCNFHLQWHFDSAILTWWTDKIFNQVGKRAPMQRRFVCLDTALKMLKKEEHKDKIMAQAMKFQEEAVINDPGAERRGYRIMTRGTFNLKPEMLSQTWQEADCAEVVRPQVVVCMTVTTIFIRLTRSHRSWCGTTIRKRFWRRGTGGHGPQLELEYTSQSFQLYRRDNVVDVHTRLGVSTNRLSFVASIGKDGRKW